MKRSLGLTVLALVLMQGAIGCSYSEDRTSIESTYMAPKTAMLIDKPSNETIWSMEIPPQTVLVMDLNTGEDSVEMMTTSKANPVEMKWELYPINSRDDFWGSTAHYSGTPIKSGTKKLSGNPVVIKYEQGKPIDPATVPTERSAEEIEKDLLPEPDDKEDELPEPDADDSGDEKPAE